MHVFLCTTAIRSYRIFSCKQPILIKKESIGLRNIYFGIMNMSKQKLERNVLRRKKWSLFSTCIAFLHNGHCRVEKCLLKLAFSRCYAIRKYIQLSIPPFSLPFLFPLPHYLWNNHFAPFWLLFGPKFLLLSNFLKNRLEKAKITERFC